MSGWKAGAQEKMEEAKTKNGLIGFFDILGYQSFLENNDAETAASEVLHTINSIDTKVSSGLIASVKEPGEELKEVVDSIQWLVFSDTILMAMEWDEASTHKWAVFTAAALELCRQMFDFGLPLRGAIKNGKYLVSKSCFAGRAIVDAYHAETTLNLAGCTIDERIIEIVKGRLSPELIETVAVGYMAPLTDGQYKKMFLLNYLLPHGDLPKPNAVDIPQMVLNSFWAHRKDITESAEIKARNTERFLRFLAHRFPHYFAST